jgi:hypothetical protein
MSYVALETTTLSAVFCGSTSYSPEVSYECTWAGSSLLDLLFFDSGLHASEGHVSLGHLAFLLGFGLVGACINVSVNLVLLPYWTAQADTSSPLERQKPL